MARTVELHLARHADTAWAQVIRPCLERGRGRLERTLVVVPTRGQAQALKQRCLRVNLALLGVEFLTPNLARQKWLGLGLPVEEGGLAGLGRPALGREFLRLGLRTLIARRLSAPEPAGLWRSLASDPQFLTSPQGSVDPQKELEATLAAMFEPADLENPGRHPQCRHVARFHWLVQVLHIDERLVRQPCEDFQQWRDAIDPGRVSLVFASAYLNNPSSMYGHTFLRIDAPPERRRPEQWSYTLSYAADANPKDGISFAYKGLLGLYHGTMASPTYFLKLREYSLIENRDLWEYQLQLHLPV